MKINFRTHNKKNQYIHKLPFRHLTTFGVNTFKPTLAFEVSSNEHLEVDCNQRTLLAPLVGPTFGDFKVKSHAFFVPWRLVYPSFNDYFSSSADVSSFSDIENFSLKDLFVWMQMQDIDAASTDVSTVKEFFSERSTAITFTTASFSSLESFRRSVQEASRDISSRYDYHLVSWTQLPNDLSTLSVLIYGFNFSPNGRMIWNCFQSLGYSLPSFRSYVGKNENPSSQLYWSDSIPDASWASAVRSYMSDDSLVFSSWPLLSLSRVFYDFIYPSRYIEQEQLSWLFQGNFSGLGKTFVDDVFPSIFKIFRVFYDNDFYTSLWANLNQPAAGALLPSNSLRFNRGDTTQTGKVFGEEVDTSTSSVSQNSSSPTVSGTDYSHLTNYGLRWLERFSDFVTRNNLGGTRFREYMRAHFGYVTKEQRDYNCCTHIKSWSQNVSINSVQNTASSQEAILGERGAVGDSSGSDKFVFDTPENGIIIVLSAVVPVIGYYQGRSPWCEVLRDKFDLFIPEYDDVQFDGVPYSQVASLQTSLDDMFQVPTSSTATSSPASSRLSRIFGFAPRYSTRYKVGRDWLTGDFCLGSRNSGLDSFHTFRNVFYSRGSLTDSQTVSSSNSLVLDGRFLTADNQYQRIFASTGSLNDGEYEMQDSFFSFFSYFVTRSNSMRSLSDSIPLFDKDGRDVTSNYEGSQL